jgi:hypothetical protein
MFCEKNVNMENTGFEIGKNGIIPVSVLTIQYRIWEKNTKYLLYRKLFELFN